MMAFLVGLFLGVVLAGFTMCLTVVASDADAHLEACKIRAFRKKQNAAISSAESTRQIQK